MIAVKKIGILALQGDYAAHAAAIRRAGRDSFEARTVEDIEAADVMIMPGGESTVIGNLLVRFGFMDTLVRRIKRRHARLRDMRRADPSRRADRGTTATWYRPSRCRGQAQRLWSAGRQLPRKYPDLGVGRGTTRGRIHTRAQDRLARFECRDTGLMPGRPGPR